MLFTGSWNAQSVSMLQRFGEHHLKHAVNVAKSFKESITWWRKDFVEIETVPISISMSHLEKLACHQTMLKQMSTTS